MSEILATLISDFTNPNILLGNFMGIIALIFICISFQCSTKKKYLVFQLLCNIFYTLQYFILNAISAAYMSILQILKAILFYLIETNKLKISKNKILIAFCIIAICIGIFTYTTPISIIPIVLNLLYTIAMWADNLSISLSINSLCPVAWLIYNFTFKAYTSACGNIVEFTFAVIGLIRSIHRGMKLKKLKKKRTNRKSKTKNKNTKVKN